LSREKYEAEALQGLYGAHRGPERKRRKWKM